MKKITMILGASENPKRYSNIVVKKLNSLNFPVVAVGNKTGLIDQIPIQPEVNINEKIDTISVYLSPKNQVNYYDIIRRINPRRIIFNPGTENETLEKIANESNIEVIHACTLVMLSTNQYE